MGDDRASVFLDPATGTRWAMHATPGKQVTRVNEDGGEESEMKPCILRWAEVGPNVKLNTKELVLIGSMDPLEAFGA